jgi:transcriptional regulator with XRE-family HTH domain
MAQPYPHVTTLAKLLAQRRLEKNLSYSDLADLARVDAAQIYRICQGRFKRLSQSVLQICAVLEIDPPGSQVPVPPSSTDAQLITTELMATWDQTSAGANRLAEVLRAVRAYRG